MEITTTAAVNGGENSGIDNINREYSRNGVFCSFGFGGRLVTPMLLLKKKKIIVVQHLYPSSDVAATTTNTAVDTVDPSVIDTTEPIVAAADNGAQTYEEYPQMDAADVVGDGNDNNAIESNKVDYVLNDNIYSDEAGAVPMQDIPTADINEGANPAETFIPDTTTAAATEVIDNNINENINMNYGYDAVNQGNEMNMYQGSYEEYVETNEEYSSSLCIVNLADLLSNNDEDENKIKSENDKYDVDEEKENEMKASDKFIFPPLLSSISVGYKASVQPDVVCKWIESEMLFNNDNIVDIAYEDSSQNDGDIQNATKLLWKVIASMIKANAPSVYFPSEVKQTKSITKSTSLVAVSPESFEGRVLSLLTNSISSDNKQYKEIESSISKMKQAEKLFTPNVLIDIETSLSKGELDKALNLAVENELWPIAIVIANHISISTYRKVVSAYTSKMFPSSSSTFRTLQLLSGSGSDIISDNSTLSSDSLTESWKQTLVSIISNGIPDTTEVLEVLGDKIWRDTGSVSAAHICYLLAGHSILEFGHEARVFLLGADHLTIEARKFFVSPASIRRSECYLYALSLAGEQLVSEQAQNQIQSLDDASSSFLSFLSSKIESFQPFRLVYAMWLADLGHTEQARTWLNSILASRPDMSDAFGRQLEIFEDRLRKGCEIQDDQTPIYWTLPDPGIENEISFQGQVGNGYYNQQEFFADTTNIMATPHQQPNESAQNFIQNMGGDIPVFDPTISDYPYDYQAAQNGEGAVTKNDAKATATASIPWMDPTTNIDSTSTTQNGYEDTPFMASDGNAFNNIQNGAPLHRQEEEPIVDEKPKNGDADNSSVASTVSTSANTVATQPPATQAEPNVAAPLPAQPTAQKAPAAAPSNSSMSMSFSDPFGGIKGWLVQKIYGIPKDAHVANIGGKLEAYYDKEKKRWVFPGEDPNASAATPPPPPMAQAEAPATNPAGGNPASNSNGPNAPNEGANGPVPAIPAATGQPPAGNPFARGNASAKSRYVDPFSR